MIGKIVSKIQILAPNGVTNAIFKIPICWYFNDEWWCCLWFYNWSI